jgi:hypothetical protein
VNAATASTKAAAVALAVAAAVAGSPNAQACGYHDPSGYGVGMLNWAYPDALHVRTAVWMAQGEGLLVRAAPVIDADPASPAYRLQQMMRLRQTQAGLDALRDGLDAAVDDRALPAFAIVLIGPMLWARFERVNGVLVMASHVAGPAPGDVVIVTDEPVVAALVDGRLTPPAARERGLVKFYGDAQNAEQVSTSLERLAPTPGRQASHTHTHPESR